MSKGIDNMFMTPLFYSEIDEPLRKTAEDEIRRLRKTNLGMKEHDTGWYWQTNDDLHKNEKIKDLVDCCVNELNEVFDYLGVIRDSIEINNMWAGITKEQYFHQKHIHQNSYYSGLIYIKCSENAAPTIFCNPSEPLIQPDLNRSIPENKILHASNVKQGYMIMWPSWIPHYLTNNFNDDVERITIAFTAMPIGPVTGHTRKITY
jgi:uncharacterized protein (TIGR02466 family)